MFTLQPKSWQLKTLAMFSYTKMRMAGSTWLKRQLVCLGLLPRVVLYQDLSLPLSLFIRCIIDSDLTALIIKGKPEQNDLVLAWTSIYKQYIDLNYENESVYIVNLEREIALLKTLVSEVETALYFLAITYHEGCIRVLKENGFKDVITEENKDEVLPVMQNKLTFKKLTLASKEQEHKDYVAAHAGEEISESYFIKTLMRIAKFQGVSIIRTKDINVKEYIIYIKEYLKYVEEKANQLDGKER